MLSKPASSPPRQLPFAGCRLVPQDVCHRRVVFGRVQAVNGFRTRVERRNSAARTRARVSTVATAGDSRARTAGAARERKGKQARRLEAVAAQGASAGGGSDHGCFSWGSSPRYFGSGRCCRDPAA